jgi:hypothetical protein
MLPAAGGSVSSGTGAFVIRGGAVSGGLYNGAAGIACLQMYRELTLSRFVQLCRCKALL